MIYKLIFLGGKVGRNEKKNIILIFYLFLFYKNDEFFNIIFLLTHKKNNFYLFISFFLSHTQQEN